MTGSSFNYDQIGNITTDATAGQTFVWTPHGRIDQRYQTTNPANKVENVYDGQGNVVMEKTTNAGVVTKTYFIRDATGNVLAVYKQNGGGAVNVEKRYIYGSDQIASLSGPNTYSGSSITALPERLYELRDHLGNIRVVFGHNTPSNNLASGIKAYFNYYAFGSGQVERIPTAR